MRLTAACLLLCLLAPALLAQKDETKQQKWESYLREVYLDPALVQGDYDAHAANLLKHIKDEPGSTGAVMALRACLELEPRLSDPRSLYELLAGFATGDFKVCNWRPWEFADAYVKLAKQYDTSLAWQTVARRWNGVSQASYIGPFADGTAGIYDETFPPEVMLDFGASCDGAYGPVKWQTMKHSDELDSTLSLYEQSRWSGYGYYIATRLDSDQPRKCTLLVKLSGPAKLWLNGKPLCNADARRENIPNELEFSVDLPHGGNVLLVKLSTNSNLRVRLFDKSGRPVSGVVAVAPDEDTPRMQIKSGDAPAYPQSSDLYLARKYPETGRDPKSPVVEGLSDLMAAEIYDHYGMSIRATTAAEEARRVLPDEPLVQLAFLHWIAKGPLYSDSDERKLKRSISDALLKADPALIPAVFAKADLLATNERYRDAVRLLRGALEHTPVRWRVHLKLAELFSDAGWRPEREAAIKAALREAPTAVPVLRAAAEYFGNNDALAREMELDRKCLEQMPGNRDAHLSLANTLSRTGDVAGAIRHLRVLVANDPANDFMQRQLASALVANGDLTNALAVYEKLASRTAQPEQAFNLAARACLQLGRDEEGAKYLERVLQADPSQHTARRELQRMRGESEDFWSKYAVSWDEIMKHDISADRFPRAESAVLLDESIQHVYADGSSVSYVHMVRKILSQEGVDDRGKVRVEGELVTARTVEPDGTVLEPISQPGGMLEFPGVKVGSYLEVAWLAHAGASPLHTLDGGMYYFADQHLGEPFAISRWIVDAPSGMNLNVSYHNMRKGDPGVTISAATGNDRTVYTWDVRNPKLPELERFMPSPLEIIPWVQCMHPRDWRARARKLADDGLGDIMDTPLIRAKAVELTKGLKGDLAKARAIYRWVNATFTTEGDAWNAHQALRTGAGDRQPLFISLCNAAGIDLGFACVDATQPYQSAPKDRLPRPDWAYPDKDAFAGFYVVVRGGDGANVYLNMNDRLRPFGEIAARSFNAPAILWRDEDYTLTHLPGGDREKDRFENKVTISLAADGSAKLKGSITIRGERSYAAKEGMRTTSNDELCSDLEATLAEQYKGFEADKCVFPHLGDVGEPLVQGYEGSVRKLATKTDDGLTLELPGEKLGRLMSALVGTRKRESDVVLNFSLVQTDEIRIKPPKGMAFGSVPKDLVYPTAPLVYELKFRIEDGDLVVKRKLVLGPGRFQPEEYPDLSDQVKHIKQAEESTLKLVKQD